MSDPEHVPDRVGMHVRNRLNKSDLNGMEGDEDEAEKTVPSTNTVDGESPSNGNARVLHRMAWTEMVEETRIQLMTQFGEQLDHALHGIVERVQQKEERLRGVAWHSDYMEDKSRSDQKNRDVSRIPVKVFRQRDSVLTELFQLTHIRTVYHMFIAILVLFTLNIICQDLLSDDETSLTAHFELFQFAFGGLREVVLFWIKMQATTLLVPFIGFLIWCTRRSDTLNVGPFDWFMMTVYAVYQLLFFTVPIQFVIYHQLPPASSAIVVLEQIRMLMKSHAFVRTSVEDVFQHITKQKQDQKPQPQQHSEECKIQPWCPDFSHYLYFLFAPVLIYRQSYPRTREIRWSYVVSNLLQVCGCVLLSYYVLVRFCFTEFSQFGQHTDYTLRQFILTSTATSVPGGLIMLLTFFAALHSWMNAFAEMLRFGDRLFYKDWWNSTTFSVWYRTWNVLVHDWLFTYLYRDLHLFAGRERSSPLLTGVVFWLSAAVHEYALTMIFRFCYPALFVFFAFAGFPFIYMKGSGRGWNVVIWVLLFTGWGQMMCLYSMEWYARINCQPVMSDPWLNAIVPHSWFCQPLNSLNRNGTLV